MGHRTRGSNDKAIMWYVLLFVTAINVKLVHFVSGALCLTLNSSDFALKDSLMNRMSADMIVQPKLCCCVEC